MSIKNVKILCVAASPDKSSDKLQMGKPMLEWKMFKGQVSYLAYYGWGIVQCMLFPKVGSSLSF